MLVTCVLVFAESSITPTNFDSSPYFAVTQTTSVTGAWLGMFTNSQAASKLTVVLAFKSALPCHARHAAPVLNRSPLFARRSDADEPVLHVDAAEQGQQRTEHPDAGHAWQLRQHDGLRAHAHHLVSSLPLRALHVTHIATDSM